MMAIRKKARTMRKTHGFFFFLSIVSSTAGGYEDASIGDSNGASSSRESRGEVGICVLDMIRGADTVDLRRGRGPGVLIRGNEGENETKRDCYRIMCRQRTIAVAAAAEQSAMLIISSQAKGDVGIIVSVGIIRCSGRELALIVQLHFVWRSESEPETGLGVAQLSFFLAYVSCIPINLIHPSYQVRSVYKYTQRVFNSLLDGIH